MQRTLSLDKELQETEEVVQEEDRGALGRIEEMVGKLLIQYQELKKERDEILVSLEEEREKGRQLEEKLEILSQDKERVKTRIDQLLHRLKGIDL
jgi:chromosome segregation ATPase